LGVDLIPPKTCTLDCVYCQIGRTTEKSIERREFVPLEDVAAEIARVLAGGVRPDYITLAGSGEPTLYSRLGELIDRIHSLTDVPVDVLTNGTLLFDPRVRDEVARADLIVPSLDAGDAATFERINRPAPAIGFDQYIDGLREFCRQHGSKVWLEVFIVQGINDSDEAVDRIAAIANDLGVARIQLNTAVRPPAEPDVQAVTPQRLAEIADRFEPRAEVVADFPEKEYTGQFQGGVEAVLETLRRRPCTLDDLAAGLDMHRPEIAKVLEKLLRAGRIAGEQRQGRLYYLAVREKPAEKRT